jgi:hypothetical protein
MDTGVVSRIGTVGVMKLIAIRTPSSSPSGALPRPGKTSAVEEIAASRALVALTPVAAPPTNSRLAHRPAAFLAHLIAVKAQHPQTRERRRAEPGEAAQAYQAAILAKPAISGKILSQAT